MTTTQVSTVSNVVQSAYNRQLYFALRSQPLFEMVADVKPAEQPMPGSAVIFSNLANLSTATTALTETSDITPVALSNPSQVTVTLVEQGNGVELTAKLRATGFVDIDAATINVLGYNAADSLDVIARNVLEAGTNVRYANGGTARASLTPNNTLKGNDIRYVVAKLRGGSAMPKKGNYYVAFMHPDVCFDLRNDTATGQWRESHIYASPEAIFAGEAGAFEGAIIVETSRTSILADSGSSPTTTDVYLSTIVGQQALAKAAAIEPHLVQSPITDRLRRIVNYGWYALLGYSRFREASIYRIESSSAAS